MKQKNAEFYDKWRFFIEKVLLSPREIIVICSLSLIIELWNRILFMPSFAKWKFTVWAETTLFSLLVYWQVFVVCVFALIPIIIILYVILLVLLEKNVGKLKGVNPQWEKIPWHKNNRYKKNNKGYWYETVVAFFSLVLVCAVTYISPFSMAILYFYYGVFKQARLYCRVKGELKGALQEQKTTFVKS